MIDDRRTFTLLAVQSLLYALLPSTSNAATAYQLPLAQSLQNDLARAITQNQPLVVMVGFASCPYCKIVRQSYLPAIKTEYKLSVVEIDMHTDTPVRDFSGNQTTHRKLAKDWQVKISPTLLFFGKDGREVTKRLVGVSPDFYSAYLDERIIEALASFKP